MQIKKLSALFATVFIVAFNFTGCKDKGNTSSESSSTVSSRPSVSSEETPVDSDDSSNNSSGSPSSVISKPVNSNASSEPHLHAYLKTKIEPTCTADGYTLYKCSCGKWYTDSLVPKTGHKWDEWKITVEPTAIAEGKEERTCEKCKETETHTVEKPTLDQIDKELLTLINDIRSEYGVERLELSNDENAEKLAEYLLSGNTVEYDAELAKLNATFTGDCQISGYDTAQKAFEALKTDENYSKEILNGEYKHISLSAVIDGDNVRWAFVLWS